MMIFKMGGNNLFRIRYGWQPPPCMANLYGVPGKLDEIRAVCDRHGAILIEDAAESMGATYMAWICLPAACVCPAIIR